MADKNIQMTQRNADNTGWDNLYPEIKPEYVRRPAYGPATGLVNAYEFNSMVAVMLVDGMSIYLDNIFSHRYSELNYFANQKKIFSTWTCFSGYLGSGC